jgi:hypothetical protein
MPYAIKALLAIVQIASDPKVIDLAHTAIKTAFDEGHVTEAEYQASIKARDDAWERLNKTK